uniref:Polyprotein n=1 Tax=Leptinotarsa solinvi-like virus 1 TaxID=3079817 RepID=A0AA96PX31_9VIRU|nr:MAG: polyprotein [Leptinotarsa solinvi-like virus 1]
MQRVSSANRSDGEAPQQKLVSPTTSKVGQNGGVFSHHVPGFRWCHHLSQKALDACVQKVAASQEAAKQKAAAAKKRYVRDGAYKREVTFVTKKVTKRVVKEQTTRVAVPEKTEIRVRPSGLVEVVPVGRNEVWINSTRKKVVRKTITKRVRKLGPKIPTGKRIQQKSFPRSGWTLQTRAPRVKKVQKVSIKRLADDNKFAPLAIPLWRVWKNLKKQSSSELGSIAEFLDRRSPREGSARRYTVVRHVKRKEVRRSPPKTGRVRPEKIYNRIPSLLYAFCAVHVKGARWEPITKARQLGQFVPMRTVAPWVEREADGTLVNIHNGIVTPNEYYDAKRNFERVRAEVLNMTKPRAEGLQETIAPVVDSVVEAVKNKIQEFLPALGSAANAGILATSLTNAILSAICIAKTKGAIRNMQIAHLVLDLINVFIALIGLESEHKLVSKLVKMAIGKLFPDGEVSNKELRKSFNTVAIELENDIYYNMPNLVAQTRSHIATGDHEAILKLLDSTQEADNAIIMASMNEREMDWFLQAIPKDRNVTNVQKPIPHETAQRLRLRVAQELAQQKYMFGEPRAIISGPEVSILDFPEEEKDERTEDQQVLDALSHIEDSAKELLDKVNETMRKSEENLSQLDELPTIPEEEVDERTEHEQVLDALDYAEASVKDMLDKLNPEEEEPHVKEENSPIDEEYPVMEPQNPLEKIAGGTNIPLEEVIQILRKKPLVATNTDILVGRDLKGLLSLLNKEDPVDKELYDTIKHLALNNVFVPGVSMRDSSAIICADGIITRMCFFLATAIVEVNSDGYFWVEGKHGTIQDLIDSIKNVCGFDITPLCTFDGTITERVIVKSRKGKKNKSVAKELQHVTFSGINIDDADKILKEINVSSTVTSCVWLGSAHVGAGYADIQNSVQEDIGAPYDQGDFDIPLFFLLGGAFGAHWVKGVPVCPTSLVRPEGLLDSLDLKALVKKWPKFVSWIFAVGSSMLVGKLTSWIGIEKRVENAMKNLGSLKHAKDSVNELEKWFCENILDEKSPEQLNIENLLVKEKELNDELKRPTHVFFQKPWLITDFEKKINDMKLHLTTACKDVKNPGVSLSQGTLTASQTMVASLKQSLAGRTVRRVPVCIYLYGKEGVGKSEAAKELAKQLATKHGYPAEGYSYSLRGTVKHFPPYHQEPICIMDEVFDRKECSSEDKILNDFKSIISQDYYNLEGAALENKNSPCNFEYVIMCSNTTPDEIHGMLPYFPDGIAATFSRMHIFECVYNQGPTEASKPRNERKRLENCGHIDFIPQTFVRNGVTMVSPGPLHSNTTKRYFKSENVVHNFDDILALCDAQYKISNQNFQRWVVKPEGDAVNHFVVNLNGKPGYGKTEFSKMMISEFSRYGFPVYISRFDELPTLRKQHLVVVDDQILAEGDKIDANREKWYMDLFNTLPSGCVILVCTNIELNEKFHGFANGTVKTLFGSLKTKIPPKLDIIRKCPFSNSGVVRRMGYSGWFDIGGKREVYSTNIEFTLKSRGFKRRGTDTEEYHNKNEVLRLIKDKYREFINFNRQSHIIRTGPGVQVPAFAPNIFVKGNASIVEDAASDFRAASMLTPKGSANGNSIVMLPEVSHHLYNVKADSLMVNYKITYELESILMYVEHLLNAFIPSCPQASLAIDLENLPPIRTVGRDIYVLGATEANSDVRVIATDFSKHEVTLGVGKDTCFTIDYLAYYQALQDGNTLQKYGSLPEVLIDFMNTWIKTINTSSPGVADQIRSLERQSAWKSCKAEAGLFLLKAKTWVNEHPIITAFAGLCFALYSVGVIISVLLPSKDEGFTKADIKREGVEHVLALLHAGQVAQLVGKRQPLVEAISEAKKLDRIEFYNAFDAIIAAESKKGNRSMSGRKHLAKRSKKFQLSDGSIAYSDDGHVIVGFYDPINDRYVEHGAGGKLPKGAKELSWKDELGIIAEMANKAMPLPKSEALDDNPLIDMALPTTPAMAAIKKVQKNMVHVFGVHHQSDLDANVIDYKLSTRMNPHLLGIGIGGKYLMCPRHVITNRKKYIYIRDSRTAPFEEAHGLQCAWYKADLVWQASDYDIAIFVVRDSTFPSFANIYNLMCKKPESATSANITMARFEGAKGITLDHGDAYFCPEPIRVTGLDNKEYKITEAAQITFFNATTKITGPGSCGTPYFYTDMKRQDIFAGFHVAAADATTFGLSNLTYCQLFTPAFLEVVQRFICPAVAEMKETPADVASVMYSDPDTNNFIKVCVNRMRKGTLPRLPDPQPSGRVMILGTAKVDHDSNTGSHIKPTRFSKDIELLVPNLKAPVVLDETKLPQEMRDLLPEDRHGAKSSTVLQENMWSDPLGVGESEAFMNEVLTELQPYFNSLHPHYRVLNNYEVLNGVKDELLGVLNPMATDTSAGYMPKIMHSRTKKSDYIETNPMTGERSWKKDHQTQELLASLVKYEDQAKLGKIPAIPYKNARKMEKLDKAKVYKPRIFTIADIRQVCMERRFCGAFAAANASNPNSHNAVGITVRGFDPIAKAIIAKGQGFSGDYSRYDKHLHPKIAEVSHLLKANVAYMHTGDPDIRNAVESVLDSVHKSINVTMDTVYLKTGGLNSGAAMTEDDNSDCNYIYTYCAYKALMPKELKEKVPDVFSHFEQHVFVRCYGDDLIVGVSDAVKGWFNLLTVAKYHKDVWGMVLDTADKDGKVYKTKPIGELKFISRSFVKIEQTNGTTFWAGALKKEAISGLLHWTSHPTAEQVASQLSTALEEAAIWDHAFFISVLQSIKIAFKKMPELTSLVTLMSRTDLRNSLYRSFFGINERPLIALEGHKESLLCLHSESFNDPKTMNLAKKNKHDFISMLNIAWQANRITEPCYSEVYGEVIVYFVDHLSKREFTGKGTFGRKTAKKMEAAKQAYNSWVAHTTSVQPEMDNTEPSLKVPATNATPVAGGSGGSENPVPQTLYTLPQQTATAPSALNTGAGEIMDSTSAPAMEVIEMNPETAPPDMPQLSGRPFSLEEYLWNQWIPMADSSFSSNSAKGDVLFTLSSNPMQLTPLHAAYANFHKSATFASECMLIIVGAMNVAGMIVVGWVPDINKKSFTIGEIMSTAWKIIDVNGTKTIKFHVRDARQDKFYRNLNDDGTENPFPGLVGMVLAPLNNMYSSTTSVYSVTIQKFARFAADTMFFNPVDVDSYKPTLLRNPTIQRGQYPLSQFTNEPFAIFVGGSSVPVWSDLEVQTVPKGWSLLRPKTLGTSPLNIASSYLYGDPEGQFGSAVLIDGFPMPKRKEDEDYISNVTVYIGGTILDALSIQGFYADSTNPKSIKYKAERVSWYANKLPETNVKLVMNTNTKGRIQHQLIADLQQIPDDEVDKNKLARAPWISQEYLFPPTPYQAKQVTIMNASTGEYRPLQAINPQGDPNIVFSSSYSDDLDAGKTVTYVVGVPTVKKTSVLAGRLKKTQFVVPGGSIVEGTAQTYSMIPADLELRLMDFFDRTYPNSLILQFTLRTATGVICTCAYMRNTAFVSVSEDANLISTTLYADDIVIDNIIELSSPSSLEPYDMTMYASAVAATSSNLSLGDLRKRLSKLQVRSEAAAAAAILGGNAIEGIGKGITAWWNMKNTNEQNQLNRDLAWKTTEGNWNLERWRTSGNWAQDRWVKSGQWQNNLDQIKDRANAQLRNGTLRSYSALNSPNREGNGNSSNGNTPPRPPPSGGSGVSLSQSSDASTQSVRKQVQHQSTGTPTVSTQDAATATPPAEDSPQRVPPRNLQMGNKAPTRTYAKGANYTSNLRSFGSITQRNPAFRTTKGKVSSVPPPQGFRTLGRPQIAAA